MSITLKGKHHSSNTEFKKGNKSLRCKITNEQLIRDYQHRRYSIDYIAKKVNMNRNSLVKRLHLIGFKIKNNGKYVLGHTKRVTHGFYIIQKRYKDKYPFCHNCGWDLSIDLHHIIPISCGGKNIESNLITLCPNCHRLAHKGIISIEYLKKIKKVI